MLKRNSVAKAKKRVVTFADDEGRIPKRPKKVIGSFDGEESHRDHRDADGPDLGNRGRVVDEQAALPDFLIGRPATGPPSLLTVQEVARILRCSVSSLNKWRVSGRGPRFVRVGSRVRYRINDVATWVAAQTRRSTSEMKTAPAG
jgi:excisionase family DNA binding protein